MAGYEVIGFLTDYGLEDGFVAACHGVMAGLAPGARVIDVTHLVPAHDVRRGSLVLAETAPAFPPAVFLAVVDPGVGTLRRAVTLDAGPSLLVGPDNGLLVPAADALGGVRRAVVLGDGTDGQAASATFHGRDVFAPAAARLAAGTDPSALGHEVDPSSLVRLPAPHVRTGEGWLETEVLTVDHFGNVQLAARPDDLPGGLRPTGVGASPGEPGPVRVRGDGGEHQVPYGRTFADVPTGALVLLVDSAGRLALAVRGGSAATRLATHAGDRLTLEPVAG